MGLASLILRSFPFEQNPHTLPDFRVIHGVLKAVRHNDNSQRQRTKAKAFP